MSFVQVNASRIYNHTFSKILTFPAPFSSDFCSWCFYLYVVMIHCSYHRKWRWHWDEWYRTSRRQGKWWHVRRRTEWNCGGLILILKCKLFYCAVFPEILVVWRWCEVGRFPICLEKYWNFEKIVSKMRKHKVNEKVVYEHFQVFLLWLFGARFCARS